MILWIHRKLMLPGICLIWYPATAVDIQPDIQCGQPLHIWLFSLLITNNYCLQKYIFTLFINSYFGHNIFGSKCLLNYCLTLNKFICQRKSQIMLKKNMTSKKCAKCCRQNLPNISNSAKPRCNGLAQIRKNIHPPTRWVRVELNSYILGYIKIGMVHVERKLWTGTKVTR